MGEYWRCWSCGQSYSKVELFRIQNSLSYEEACVGLLKHYGIVPIPINPTSVQPLIWLNREEVEALGFFNGAMQIQKRNGTQKFCSLTVLFNKAPEFPNQKEIFPANLCDRFALRNSIAFQDRSQDSLLQM